MVYDRPGIDRALKMHSAAASDVAPTAFKYHGASDGKFSVSMFGEIMQLSPREAWVLCFALRGGRDIGHAIGAGKGA